MLEAQLKGKLTRKEEHMEDLLTSNVFGSIKYVTPKEGLAPILAAVEDINGKGVILQLKEIIKARYEFWPQLCELQDCACEPDVLVNIHFSNNDKVMLLVEAKYHSDKSSFADTTNKNPKDQLAKEWYNLTLNAFKEKAIPMILYVTADIEFPADSIEESQKELLLKGLPAMTVYWISWRRIYSLFSKETKDTILGDLARVLLKQGLTFFEQKSLGENIVMNWSFHSEQNWAWIFNPNSLQWQYSENKTVLKWSYISPNVKWRFEN